ncbi:MAG: hypothetical protein QM756_19215 [Polyangiaceae bacterium]
MAVGCTYGEHHSSNGSGVVDGPECTGPSREGTIDADGLIDTKQGDGVGVFVEYASGGHWHVFATCDTNISSKDCMFDVVVHSLGKSGVLSAVGDDLEDEDSASLFGVDGIQMVSYTAADFDGFYLDTDPGAALQVDVLLDNACGASYVYWLGGGGIHTGAPSTPFELVPSAP